ncbi:MAG: hypothetical protein AB7L66_15190 [Gemmatimonadales bacterium]
MLTPADEARIRAGFNSSDHDYFVLAGLAGEPFLRHGLLCYFDGTTVEVVGFPLAGPGGSTDLERRTRRVLDEWAADPSVSYIYYYGPVALDEPFGGSWICHYHEPPRPEHVDVFVDLTQPLRKRRQEDIRRARARGISVTMTRRSYLGHEHIRLLTPLFSRGDMTTADACSLTNVVSILRAPETIVFEAHTAGRLVGFAVTHHYFEATPMVVTAAFDPAFPGGSDAIYGAALAQFRDRGATRLGLGYAAEGGLYQYKTKWGTSLLGEPFQQRVWGRESAPEPDECLYWQWRLLCATEMEELAAEEA